MLQPQGQRAWPDQICYVVCLSEACLIILGIYALTVSPTLFLAEHPREAVSFHAIRSIESVTLAPNFFQPLPEFFAPTTEAAWWQMHERVHAVLHQQTMVTLSLRTAAGDTRSIRARVGRKPLREVLHSTWLIYLVSLLNTLSAILIFRRHPSTPGRLLSGFFLAFALYLSSTAPVVGREVTLPPTVFTFFIHLIYIAAGGMMTLVHFALIFPQPKQLIRRHAWLTHLAYGSLILAILSYCTGLTAFGTTLPLVCGAVGLMISALTHSYVREHDRFLRKQIGLLLLAPILVSLFFVGAYILPGTTGMPLVSSTCFALFSLILPFSLPWALDNFCLYQERRLATQEVQQVKERLRMDLHDMVLNNLAAITLSTQVSRLHAGTDSESHEMLRYVQLLATETAQQLREFLQMIEDDGCSTWTELCARLRYCGEKMAEPHGIILDVVIAPAIHTLPPPSFRLRIAWYLVCREALLNAVKHAQARHITVTVYRQADWLRCEIQDDGGGFDPAATPTDHYGLRNMQQRVHDLGGLWHLDTSVGKGSRITCAFPWH